MSNTTGNTGKNAYEIRLEVLQMALGLAESRWHATLEQARDGFLRRAEGDSVVNYALPPDNRQAEALASADKFYSFVENKQT